jgi:hypothetical protein
MLIPEIYQIFFLLIYVVISSYVPCHKENLQLLMGSYHLTDCWQIGFNGATNSKSSPNTIEHVRTVYVGAVTSLLGHARIVSRRRSHFPMGYILARHLIVVFYHNTDPTKIKVVLTAITSTILYDPTWPIRSYMILQILTEILQVASCIFRS